MQSPSEQTFTEILEDNKDRIFRICRIYAVAPIEPEDLFQEVVFQIWKSFPTFKNKSSISTWIYKIGLNVCYSAKLKLEKNNHKMDRLESIKFVPVDVPRDEDQQDKYQALQDCILKLNEIDKSIIILYLEELPYKEIAAITGLSENHIAVKMKRIRKILLDCITPKLK
ncbi:sigma-70 family RNA polymerase sigma factor [Fulvivirgaceae bacterium BMA10]|uniref:Sigma-70 family RNA polymerase sigma factor n=1 Tax=Splendidivirga corallicola TaxID=3051826 RepID=A0ABT8KTA2_9BACT|nr:sigma-70 family RNA polymerase sigma factor [Fulvivirgaceae bacterium BMA10]